MKNKFNRSDALFIFSLIHAFSKTIEIENLTLTANLALEKEKHMSSEIDNKRAKNKIVDFFKNVPSELSDLDKDSGKLTVLMFIKELVVYITKHRGARFYHLDEIIDYINEELKKSNGIDDKSDSLLRLLDLQ